jgi:oxygen-independent coproporphyrinogen-3 oxidase
VAGKEPEQQALDRFEAAVRDEFSMRFSGVSPGESRKLKSLYFGGGTPSLLGSARVKKIIDHIRNLYSFDDEIEITLEINPYSEKVDAKWVKDELSAYKGAGVTRLSVGVQSSDEKLLRWLDREHSREDTLSFLGNADAAGFKNLSVDVLYGVPGQTSKQLEKTLKEILSFQNVKHLSAYCLTLMEGNPHFKKLPEDDQVAEVINWLEIELKLNGFQRYEVSNFSQSGYEADHNSAYWKSESYVGLGPGASGFISKSGCIDPVYRPEFGTVNLIEGKYGYRTRNAPNLLGYLELIIDKKSLPLTEIETLNFNSAKTEQIYCGLRSLEGLSGRKYCELFEEDLLEVKSKLIGQSLEHGLLKIVDLEDDRILKPTSKGWSILDVMVSRLSQ